MKAAQAVQPRILVVLQEQDNRLVVRRVKHLVVLRTLREPSTVEFVVMQFSENAFHFCYMTKV